MVSVVDGVVVGEFDPVGALWWRAVPHDLRCREVLYRAVDSTWVLTVDGVRFVRVDAAVAREWLECHGYADVVREFLSRTAELQGPLARLVEAIDRAEYRDGVR